jgi:hypothetical protein
MKAKRMFSKQAKLLLVVLFTIGVPSLSNAKESAQDGLQRCGLIGDTLERIACYDQLGGRDNSTAEKAMAEKVIAEKAVAEKAMAEKAMAEKAMAEKVITEKATVEKVITEKAIEQPALPPDDLGAGSLTHRRDKKVEPPVSVIVKVTECRRRGGNEKYIFYLEGGQVWKQISDKRLYFKECNFSATILKDFFGYKMLLEDGKKKFRISRIR